MLLVCCQQKYEFLNFTSKMQLLQKYCSLSLVACQHEFTVILLIFPVCSGFLVQTTRKFGFLVQTTTKGRGRGLACILVKENIAEVLNQELSRDQIHEYMNTVSTPHPPPLNYGEGLCFRKNFSWGTYFLLFCMGDYRSDHVTEKRKVSQMHFLVIVFSSEHCKSEYTLEDCLYNDRY